MRRLFLALLLTGASEAPDVLTIAGEPFTQTDIVDARAVADGTGTPAILITFTPEATKRLASVSSLHIGEKVSIAYGPRVLIQPVIRESIASGSVEISGAESFDSASALARLISGKAPLPESLEE